MKNQFKEGDRKMEIKKFYGTEKSNIITYLEFGEINIVEGKKKVWDFRLHQKAYDWLMLGRYMNDILSYQSMSEQLGVTSLSEIARTHKDEIHHADETSLSLSKLIALHLFSKKSGGISFFDFGQTIFGCIEGMEFCQKLARFLEVDFPLQDIKKVQWYGVDISEMFNKVAMIIHSDYKVTTAVDFSHMPDRFDVFYSKGITLLYAVRSAEELYNILNKGTCSIFDYSFTLSGEQTTTVGSGKTIKYFDYKDFSDIRKRNKRKLYVRKKKSFYDKQNDRIFVDCVYADEDICREFMKIDIRVRKEMMSKLSSVPEALVLLDAERDAPVEWISIEEFVEGIKE